MAESDEEAYETSALLEKGDFTSLLPIKVGPYIQGVDGFFRTFSQGLAKLGETVTVQELRMKCKRFAEDNPPSWFTKSVASTEYLDSSMIQGDIDMYIGSITDDREGQAAREGRILCQFYKTTLYVIYPYVGIYYIMMTVDESGVKYNEVVDLFNTRNIYIADMDNEYYQTVSIDISQTSINETLTITDGSTNSDPGCATVNNIEGLLINVRRDVIIRELKELECAIMEGNKARVVNIDKFLHDNDYLDRTLTAELSGEVKCSKNDFIILATEYDRVDILYYLLHSTNILYYLTREQTDVELEDEERREAFYYAMCCDDIKMLEILYDYWCSSMHWARRNQDTENDVIRDLQRMSRLLNEARDRCGDVLVRNQQMHVDVHCIIHFTAYQIDVYTELRDIRLTFDASDNSIGGEAERARKIILNILRIHSNHGDINSIRLRKTMDDEEMSVQSNLEDDSSMYTRALLHVMYELYYRKLDFNVSLLLLDHLYILKQRLKTPDDTYQKLECALYYYIYRVSEDWRLYLPINRKIMTTDMVGVHNGILDIMKTIYDPQKLVNGPVIYFERRHFLRCLNEFKDVLENINISNNIRDKKSVPKDEVHCLTLLPYMRDDYSLKRIVLNIDVVLSVDLEQHKQFGMLIIERALQVVGEMFKNSDESLHLSTTTKALLQTAIGVETVKKLEKLRDMLSHANKGKLNEKIRIEKSQGDLFKEVKRDLETIICRIKTVLQLYKSILDKSLVSKGLILLQERFDELPDKTKLYREIIKTIFHSYNVYNHVIYDMLEADFIKKTWSKLGFTKQLFREIGLIQVNTEQMGITKGLIKKHTLCIILGTLPQYFDIIYNTLNDIEVNSDLWSSIKFELPDMGLSDTHTKTEIEKVKNTLKNLKKKGNSIDALLNSNDITLIRDYTNHWESIKEVLRFILEEVEIFENNPIELKKSRYTGHFNAYIKNSCPEDKAIKHVNEFMEMIKHEVNRLLKLYAPGTIQQSFEPREYKGIDKMIIEFNKKVIQNGKEKRAQLFECLIGRIELLKETLDHTKNILLSQHLSRYECDQKFRIVIETLLADIMNVLDECNIKSPLNKTSNLLTEISLRNVLEHGNPLLEVIGEALDSHDISTEYITWAMTVVEDSAAIKALYDLFKENVEFDTIKNDIHEKLNTEQCNTLKVFKSCKKWEDYLELIPKRWERAIPPVIKNPECWEKLIAAIKSKELEKVRVLVNGVDLDLVDGHRKAALHYAAMSGNVEIIRVLIEHGANVNVPDGVTGKRPLHYAAMNGMAAAVTTLLQHRADATLEDNQNKLAINYVNKEKHEQIFVQLARYMTVQMGFYLSVFRE